MPEADNRGEGYPGVGITQLRFVDLRRARQIGAIDTPAGRPLQGHESHARERRGFLRAYGELLCKGKVVEGKGFKSLPVRNGAYFVLPRCQGLPSVAI